MVGRRDGWDYWHHWQLPVPSTRSHKKNMGVGKLLVVIIAKFKHCLNHIYLRTIEKQMKKVEKFYPRVQRWEGTSLAFPRARLDVEPLWTAFSPSPEVAPSRRPPPFNRCRWPLSIGRIPFAPSKSCLLSNLVRRLYTGDMHRPLPEYLFESIYSIFIYPDLRISPEADAIGSFLVHLRFCMCRKTGTNAIWIKTFKAASASF